MSERGYALRCASVTPRRDGLSESVVISFPSVLSVRLGEPGSATPRRAAAGRNGHSRAVAAQRDGSEQGSRIADERGSPRVLRRERLYRRTLACADVLCAALALLTSVELLGSGQDHVRPETLLALPLVVFASKLVGREIRAHIWQLADGYFIFQHEDAAIATERRVATLPRAQ